LIFGSRNLEGALTGDPATGDDTLRFSVLSGVSAMIETMPLEKAPDACAKMMSGNASVGIGSGFRFVVVLIEAPFEEGVAGAHWDKWRQPWGPQSQAHQPLEQPGPADFKSRRDWLDHHHLRRRWPPPN
jgi:hypothetical protein